MMNSFDFKRSSPIKFHSRPIEVVKREDFEIVPAYEGEEEGPWLVDLSHRPKWDIQNDNLDEIRPLGMNIPSLAGQCAEAGGWLINRMNRTQAALWNLSSEVSEAPIETFATETSDGFCLLAVVGRERFSIMEKLSPLDLAALDRTAPYLVQGPVLHIPSQVVVLNEAQTAAILLAFSRGYGQAMADAVLEAGKEFGLCPGGERRFNGR